MSAPASYPGYSVPAGSYSSPAVRHTSHTRLLVVLGVALALLVVVGVVASRMLTKPTPAYVCPPECGRPPLGTPVQTNPRFTSRDGQFSVAYPGVGTAYKVDMDPSGVNAEFLGADGGTMRLFGEPAAGRTPKQIADQLVERNHRDTHLAYEIPNAAVGYQPGFGEIVDWWPQGSTGKFSRIRGLVLVAVKNGYALVAAAVGPYHQFSPEYGTGHPSGANLTLALDMGKYVNSFTWRGDRPR